MTKQDLVDALSEVVSSKREANDALNTVLDSIQDALKKGDDVTLTGFGTFSVVKRKARTGRNPQTGEEIQIPARKAVRFKPGSELKDSVQ